MRKSLAFITIGVGWLVAFGGGGRGISHLENQQWQGEPKSKLAAVEVDSGSVRFKRQDDGREFTFPMHRLSSEDQQALREQFALTAAAEAFESDNPANFVPRVRWEAPVLDDQNLDQWADYLWPTEQELAWRSIRWHNNLGEAAIEAKRLNRPILLWTMNGNPCGET